MTDIRPEDEPEGTEGTETPDETPDETPTTPAPPEARSRMSAVSGRVTVSEPERRSRETAAVARIGGAPARVTRSELIYTRESEHRFLRDGLRAAAGDMEAMGRLGRHYAILEDVAHRAVLSTGIAGAYPTEYLPGLLTERVAKGRVAGSFFNRIPVSDARTRTFPRVTTSTTVAKQSAEGTNVAASNFATTAVNSTPDMYQGTVDVSRQTIDGGDPDAERMILDDLTEAYMQSSESAIVTAILAGATAGPNTLTAATPHVGVIGAIVKYQSLRFLPAEGVLLPPAAYEGLLQQLDTTGRALVPYLGPTNAEGTAAAGAAGASVLGVPVYLLWTAAATEALIARRADAHYYESSIAQFRYEQVGGPGLIRIGLWAYLSAVVRRPDGVYKPTVAMADEGGTRSKRAE